MSSKIIYQIFTVFGWVNVSREGYQDHKGIKRWKFEDRLDWNVHGLVTEECEDE